MKELVETKSKNYLSEFELNVRKTYFEVTVIFPLPTSDFGESSILRSTALGEVAGARQTPLAQAAQKPTSTPVAKDGFRVP
jgi:hypothetical protein